MSTQFCIRKRKQKRTETYYVLLKSPKSYKRSNWINHRTETKIEAIFFYLNQMKDSWLIRDYKFKIIKEVHNYESDTYNPKNLMLHRVEWGV